jgi:hypothetical protein
MRGLALVLGLCACGDPVVDRQLIVDTRVLAVRAEVTDEPARATPAPGEDVTARVLVATPDPPAAVHWQLEACIAAPTTTGVPRCVERLAVANGQDAVPELTWTQPELPDGGRVAVVGIVCDAPIGSISTPWPRWTCAEGKHNLLDFDVAARADDGDNTHPDLGRDRFQLEEDAWEAAACLPVRSGSEHRITWVVNDENREPLAAGREELLLSHFTNGGDLERAFSRVGEDGSTSEQTVALTWTAPTVDDGAVREVTFHFVARDLRGGVDWTTRTACVD